ncbi:MAG: hypothetical protein HZB61_10355 [Nitrospirae bacterium]|nr:hypothetical protein [Nitrospirota bacterium]
MLRRLRAADECRSGSAYREQHCRYAHICCSSACSHKRNDTGQHVRRDRSS